MLAMESAILNRLGGGTPNYFYATNSSATTPVTLCSISGSGVLWSLVGDTHAVAPNPLITIVVDGTTVWSGVALHAGNAPLVFFPKRFNSSLTITFVSSNDANTACLAASVVTGV